MTAQTDPAKRHQRHSTQALGTHRPRLSHCLKKTSSLIAGCLLAALSCTACTGAPGTEDELLVVLTTELGDIELALYPERAPVSTANFLVYVDRGIFDGASFYRVVREDNDPGDAPIQVVQGGLMGDTFRFGSDEEIDTEQPGLAPVAHETTLTTGLSNRYGVIALARLDPGTASSEFFINLADNPVLDTDAAGRNPDGAGYATFGRVRKGMELLERIQDLPTDAPKGAASDIARQVLNDPIRIISARRK